MTELKRNIGVFGAASVGIANIIGAGIFVLSGVAAVGLTIFFILYRNSKVKLAKE
jgi:hypothetical protein